MTNNEAVEILKEMKRQSEVILNSPTTFYNEKNIVGGCETMKKHIEAYDTAIAVLLTSYDVDDAVKQLEELTIKELGIDKAKFRMDEGEYSSYCSLSLHDVKEILKAEKKE